MTPNTIVKAQEEIGRLNRMVEHLKSTCDRFFTVAKRPCLLAHEEQMEDYKMDIIGTAIKALGLNYRENRSKYDALWHHIVRDVKITPDEIDEKYIKRWWSEITTKQP